MNQSTVILGYLAAGFLVFITVRGELPTYMGFLLGAGTGAAAGSASSTAQASPSSGDVSSLVSSIAPIALAAL